MKKMMFLLVMVLCLTFSAAVVSAAPHHDNDGPRHNWSHQAYHNDNWHHSDGRADESLPFRWHERHDRYRGERIYEQGWVDRFPGLHPYRWHGDAFWYHGERVTNAVLFYNASDELVSVGFMRNGTFIFIRDDHEGYENHDSFFLSIRW